MIKKYLPILILLALITGCGRMRYINPNPDFCWPEMESSQINGRLGVYISDENIHFNYKNASDSKCCKHKTIRVGEGLRKAASQASDAIFTGTAILSGEPTDTYIKTLNLRGLLHLKNVIFDVEFVPYIEPNHSGDEINLYRIKVSMAAEGSAIDFAVSDMKRFPINADRESSTPVTRKQAGKILKQLVNELFHEAADQLARDLVNFYGARN